MSKILCMPDAHLKIDLIDRIDELMEQNPDWECVSLGDWCDDWDLPVAAYEAFFERLLEFCHKYSHRAHLCWGNHDYGYWTFPAHCSGYSADARDVVRHSLHVLEFEPCAPKVVHKDRFVLFSHAGISQSCYDRCREFCANIFDMSPLQYFNEHASREDLWRADFPLWYRPTYTPVDTFNTNILQVVGHTPVETVLYNPDTNILYTDTWSTGRNRVPLGDHSLAVIDTFTQEWEVIK